MQILGINGRLRPNGNTKRMIGALWDKRFLFLLLVVNMLCLLTMT